MASRYAHRNAAYAANKSGLVQAHAATLATRNAHNAAVLRNHANQMRRAKAKHEEALKKIKKLKKELDKALRGRSRDIAIRERSGWLDIFVRRGSEFVGILATAGITLATTAASPFGHAAGGDAVGNPAIHNQTVFAASIPMGGGSSGWSFLDHI